MKIKAMKCNKCGDIIYSRAIHDFRKCSCDLIGVDGGFDYFKIHFYTKKDYELIEFELPNVTKIQLYNDWNKQENKYGKISVNDFISRYNKLETINKYEKKI